MKRLAPFLALSLLAHGALALPWIVLIGHSSRPLAGGGSVAVEIVGADHYPPAPTQADSRKLSQARRTTASGFRLAESAGRRPAGQGAGRTAGSENQTGSGPGGNDPLLAEIRDRIERVKRYPETARRAGLEGAAVIKFYIGPQGNAEGIVIARGSGEPLLDHEALETVRRAAPFPSYPKPLEVAIRFSLDQQ